MVMTFEPQVLGNDHQSESFKIYCPSDLSRPLITSMKIDPVTAAPVCEALFISGWFCSC